MIKRISLNTQATELRESLIFESEKEARVQFIKLKSKFDECRAKIVSVEIFAPKWAGIALESVFGECDFPINHILPLDEIAFPILAGAHFTAVSGKNVKVCCKESCGVNTSMVSDGIANWFRVFGIALSKDIKNYYVHSQKNLERMRDVLRLSGFNFTDIVRTWFYNDDILSWYDDFNRARTEFWTQEGIFKSLLPASTGIGAPNAGQAAIMSGALALDSREASGEWTVKEARSPLQCGATNYGSSFSRAVVVSTPFHKRVFVSGSASISPDGRTLYFGDIDKQIDLTTRVIREILRTENMDFCDTVRATIYCRKPEYYKAFLLWQKKLGLDIPHVPAYSIVCRDDLMFEIELEAAKNANSDL